MQKQLMLGCSYHVIIDVTPEAIESSSIIQQWLYHFEYAENDVLHYYTYRDEIISAKTYEEAEVIFIHLIGDDLDYHESAWKVDVIGIDLKLDRDSPLVCTHYYHA